MFFPRLVVDEVKSSKTMRSEHDGAGGESWDELDPSARIFSFKFVLCCKYHHDNLFLLFFALLLHLLHQSRKETLHLLHQERFRNQSQERNNQIMRPISRSQSVIHSEWTSNSVDGSTGIDGSFWLHQGSTSDHGHIRLDPHWREGINVHLGLFVLQGQREGVDEGLGGSIDGHQWSWVLGSVAGQVQDGSSFVHQWENSLGNTNNGVDVYLDQSIKVFFWLFNEWEWRVIGIVDTDIVNQNINLGASNDLAQGILDVASGSLLEINDGNLDFILVLFFEGLLQIGSLLFASDGNNQIGSTLAEFVGKAFADTSGSASNNYPFTLVVGRVLVDEVGIDEFNNSLQKIETQNHTECVHNTRD